MRAGPLAAAWGAPETETEAQGAWTWASAAAATLKLLAMCAECSFLARAYCKLALLKLEASLQQAAFLRVLKKNVVVRSCDVLQMLKSQRRARFRPGQGQVHLADLREHLPLRGLQSSQHWARPAPRGGSGGQCVRRPAGNTAPAQARAAGKREVRCICYCKPQGQRGHCRDPHKGLRRPPQNEKLQGERSPARPSDAASPPPHHRWGGKPRRRQEEGAFGGKEDLGLRSEC